MIQAHDDRVEICTKTLLATMRNGWLTSLKSRSTGEDFVGECDPAAGSAMELVYAGNQSVPISGGSLARRVVTQITDNMVEIRCHNWHGDGILLLSEDADTGDLLIEPSAFSSRAGVRSVRYQLCGLRRDLHLVAPLYQGCDMAFDDPLVAGRRYEWPMTWEAGMVVAAGARGGVWMHTQDSAHRFKTLTVGTPEDPYGFGVESDNYGPIEEQRSAGGLIWRVNVYEGDWHVPAARYRDWLWQEYNLAQAERSRPEWLSELSFAVSWCPTDIAVLEAIAAKLDPKKVLLHLPNWRAYGYDEDYPLFAASDSGRAFVERCREMGFRVMPHCSSMEVDPSLPDYRYFDDFAVRDLETGRRMGWSWVDNNASQGVPNSDIALVSNKAHKVMIKIHTALPMWQSVLRERIGLAVEDLNLESVFIDVTLCAYNARQSLINGTTTTQGLLQEILYLQTLGRARPLCVGGEGLNEIIMQQLCFGQVHLMARDSGEAQLRTGKCDLNAFMFGRLVRTFGYSDLNGKTADSEMFMQSHIDHGALPTVTVRGAEDILHPTPYVAKMLDMAR